MEKLKQYAPYIIGAIIVLYFLSKMRGGGTTLVPQTQIVETPQADPFAQNRFDAFQSLIGLAGIQTQADAETERTKVASQITSRAQDIQYALGLHSLDVDLEKTNILGRAAERAAELTAWQREQDRQTQQAAIDRVYSSRQSNDIIGSITRTLGSIFGNRGGGSIFTPPTFPLSF